MELATQALTHKPRDAYYWRLFATAASFALFGFGGLCLRLLVFPLLSCLPGDATKHRRRARHTISWLFWFFIQLMQKAGVQTAIISGRKTPVVERRAQNLGTPHLYQGREDKLVVLDELLGQLNLSYEQVA